MRRLELRRLHPDDRSVRDEGPPFTRTVTLVGWNMAMGIFVYRGLHLMLGLVASFKAMPGRRRAADCGI